MTDPRAAAVEVPQTVGGTDSQQAAPASSPVPAVLEGAGRAQNALDLRPEVPLHHRPVLTFAELAALGIVPERTLRRLVAVGRVKRAVLRVGRRVRFVVQDLLDELRQAEG